MRERELDVVRDARGHLEIGAVVVEVVDGRADEHADAHGLEARAPDEPRARRGRRRRRR